MEIKTNSEEETKSFTKRLAQKIKKNKKGALVLALKGDLGSGKTTFAKGFLDYFGIDQTEVTSPTFVIMKKYQPDKLFDFIYHIDAYRLDQNSELKEINFKDILKDENNLVLIEWPERLKKLPTNSLNIYFKIVDEKREIKIDNISLLE